MSIHLVITFMGKDQTGLVGLIAATVLQEGGNWLESRMCHLGGQFAGVLRVAIPEDREAVLMKSLLQLQEAGLSLTVKADLDGQVEARRSLVALNLLGGDQVGIVSRISGLLARMGVNVEELHTELTTAPMSAGLLFKVRALLQLPDELTVEALRESLEAVASDLMVDLQLQEK